MADANGQAPAAAAAAGGPPPPAYRCVRTLRGHGVVGGEKRDHGGVVAVKFSPDGSRLASASADGTAAVWDPDSGQLLLRLQGHQAGKGVSDVAWSHADGQAGGTAAHLATASDDQTVKLWDAETGKCLRTLTGHTHYVFCVTWKPTNNILASGSFDETVRIWDAREGKCIRELPAHSDPVTAVDFNLDGTMLVSSSFDGLCRIWNVEDGRCLKTVIDTTDPPVSYVRWAPNGKYLLSATLDSQLHLWDWKSTKTPTGVQALKRYKGHKNSRHCVFACFDTSRRERPMVVAGSEDHSVYLWHLNTKKVLQVLEGRARPEDPGQGHCDVVVGVSAHPARSMIASCALDADSTIKLWEDKSEP